MNLVHFTSSEGIIILRCTVSNVMNAYPSIPSIKEILFAAIFSHFIVRAPHPSLLLQCAGIPRFKRWVTSRVVSSVLSLLRSARVGIFCLPGSEMSNLEKKRVIEKS